jgi:hypothetical protein
MKQAFPKKKKKKKKKKKDTQRYLPSHSVLQQQMLITRSVLSVICERKWTSTTGLRDATAVPH